MIGRLHDFVTRSSRNSSAGRSPSSAVDLWQSLQEILICGLLSIMVSAGAALAQPAPSATSTVGSAVTNPVTSTATTVTALRLDPAGTPTAGDVAFVETADGYIFLVKSPGEFFYNNDNPPIAFEIVSIAGTTATITSPASNGGTATFETGQLTSTFNANFSSSGSAGALNPPINTTSNSGVVNIVRGQDGDNGRAGALVVPPADGGNGRTPSAFVAPTLTQDINATSNPGWQVGSQGGEGGDGGSSNFSFWSAGEGGDGGAGGSVTATQAQSSTITTSGANNYGIIAFSRSGKAGNGGGGNLAPGGGAGGNAADGGTVTLTANGAISTTGNFAHGIYAVSQSNSAGSGGQQIGLVGTGGSGGTGANGGTVTVNLGSTGTILTQGTGAHGILALSVGGTGGAAGDSFNLLVNLANSADRGGNGGRVLVNNAGRIETRGTGAKGILAQSIGGGGGEGAGGGGLFSIALGGLSAGGGSSDPVTVTNQDSGVIVTQGFQADGIMAQSIGGSGGSAGATGGLVAIGGSGSVGGNGDTVTVRNFGTIQTAGSFARGIVVQSIGGGGGDGGNTGGLVSIGGDGSGGGNGAAVTVVNEGVITTGTGPGATDAIGILAQSIGGGGGNGGSSGSIGLFASVAVGGAGDTGGAGGNVDVTLANAGGGTPSSIQTNGARSTGVFAQSIGGGGGNGGGAFSASVGAFGSASVSVGGNGGAGGAGGRVVLTGTGASSVQTNGSDSTAIFLQSVGGGGGNGGYAASFAASVGPVAGSVAVGVGGQGSAGGNGGLVRVGTVDGGGNLTGSGFSGSVQTNGARSTGMLFQSVGGGGGNGGLSIAGSGSGSLYFSGNVSVSVGGSGAAGGVGGRVQVWTDAGATTQGASSTAILAQSVGGGGGNGGGSIAAGIAGSGGASASINAGVGGSGASGATGGRVDLISTGTQVSTFGQFSSGAIAQSVGGGGGNGGYAVGAGVAGSGGLAGAVNVGVGGSAGTGGNGGVVAARIDSNVTTRGSDSGGVLVQSVGGGGGNGGFSVSAGIAGAGGGAATVGVSLGGSGGAGGNGNTVTATVAGDIATGTNDAANPDHGDRSPGVVVQSIGGGGGNGGFSVSGSLSGAGVGSGAIDVGLGGSGSSGGTGGAVTATVNGAVTTRGADSTAVLAQSVGGGGGNGGFNVSANATGSGTGSGSVAVGLGGSGGSGATGGNVTLTTGDAVQTLGDRSSGVVAQSIGGGGGNGGFNVSGTISGAGVGSGSIAVGLGGGAGNGQDAGTVTVDQQRHDPDDGQFLVGLYRAVHRRRRRQRWLQRIGGPELSPAPAAAPWASASADRVTRAATATPSPRRLPRDIETRGTDSTGIVVQSVGGGGGNGAFNVTGTLAGAGTGSGSVGVGLGGQGAGGGNGGAVSLTATNDVLTREARSSAVVVQSVGGGGGNGGFNVGAGLSGAGTGSGSVGVGLGGRGAGGGNGGTVDSTITGTLETRGDYSTGMLTQSLGGGGGNGGFNVAAAVSVAGTGSGGAAVGLGGAAGTGGTSSDVTSRLTGDVLTDGIASSGAVVQSLGGGGGNGGMNISAAITAAGTGSGGAAVGIGGSGGTGGSAGNVASTLTGNVTTRQIQSTGVLVQSAGGGGGNGGLNVSGALNLSGTGGGAVALGIGGAGGGASSGGNATSSVTGDVTTLADDSTGVLVQSLGGGGGNGGLNVSGAVSLAKTGSAAAAIGIGGFGGDGGAAGTVTATYAGTAMTTGNQSAGLVAQAIGGGGGNGGVNVSGAISLSTNFSGGLGFGLGGFGGTGGTGGSVDHTVSGAVSTIGVFSTGVLTQSVGGGGGNGGTNVTAALNFSKQTGGAVGIGIGGFGGGASDAGALATSSVTGTVTTTGDFSTGIITQSVGGGGGNGATNVTAGANLSMNNGGALSFGMGGFGGDGGDGRTVSSTIRTSTDAPGIRTTGVESIGALAQSVGGGGGAGGTNVSGTVSLSGQNGAAISLGLGGFGAAGGDSGAVTMDAVGDVLTMGDQATGLVAQSIAGGGGSGGTNVSGALSLTKPGGSNTILSIAAGVGGFGGNGGDAGAVDFDYSGDLQAVPMTNTGGTMAVDLNKGSDGIIAQSVGGGGGNGGVNVTAGISIASFPSAGQSNNNNSGAVLVGVGGFGGTGGNAGEVDVDIATGSTVRAHGTGKSGVVAQSVGGGGGNGGLNVSGGIVSDSSLIVGVGGMGGNAGTAAGVTVTARADITVSTDPEDIETPDDTTFETKLREVLTDQVVDLVSNQLDSFALRDLFVDLGLFNEDKPDTDGSAGLLAQSIGGGGGNGGLNVSGGVAINKDGKIPSITFGIGGFGGTGNVSGNVAVDHGGTITVAGNWKHGIHAQSIAGGGGNGGLNVSGQLNYQASENGNGQTDLSIVAGLGGHGGTGADAGDVSVTSTGNITTQGYASRGVFAQSIGGGGGTGGINVTAVGTQNSSPIGIGVGGFGANGGNSGDVTVNRGTALAAAGLIQTDGIGAVGLEASSIGGGGGNAGVNAVLGVTRTTGSQSNGGTAGDRRTPVNTGVDPSVITNFNAVLDELEGNNSTPAPGGGTQTNAVAIAIGGGAGSAGNGGAVNVNHFGTIVTVKAQSHGILGQSLGGGGGNAAFNLAFMYQAGQADNNRAVGLAVGGGTGEGGSGGTVDVKSTGDISTEGDDSHGVFAQSVGGGGGNAGYNMLVNSADGGSANITIGRRGGTGGTGGDVTASSTGDIRTQGIRSHGLFAQSIGNGGGNSSSTSVSLSTPKDEDDKGTSLKLAVGLEGGEGGAAGDVSATAAGSIGTMGEEAHGVFAQSVGGGGGNAGSATGGAGEGTSISVALGGTGGTGGTGGAVRVTSTATIATMSDRAIGLFAQSIGGAGGTGGAAKGGPTNFSTLTNNVKGSNVGTTASLLLGGTGGTGMTSGTVDVANAGLIGTLGEYAHGILAQSVGGGGGKGGVVDTKVINLRGNIGNQYTIGLGGNGGTGAVSETVTVTNSAEIGTSGARSLGIFAQSVGGGGGDAQYVRNILVGPDANGATRASLLMGGTGGTGAAAGDVSVSNTGTGRIITTADASHGILAQSVGGGGGTGGDVSNISLNRSTAGAGSTSRSFQIGIGGSGGTGGTGGGVTVNNAGLVQTGGAGAHGIIAQSVGGGGGDGGQTIQGSFTLAAGDAATPSTAFSLGGSGGTGNAGGSVDVTNSDNILVQGAAAHGILAQSVGGGGGNGGMSISVAGDKLVEQATGRAFNSIAIGGAGGDAADGGNVTVTHTGTIQADGDNAYGILAQSVGGSGGNAGISIGAPLVSALDYAFSTLLGARSGTNGTGGTVVVNATGDIIMNGANSEAILQQAINGGGGNVDVFSIFSENLPTGPQATQGTTILGALGLGGDDVDGTAGADVSQTHTGNVMTMQANSTGVLTQSIGGGGGTALSQVEANDQTDLTMNARLGAINTDNAPGGAITAQRTGNAVTQGAFSSGGQTQSIGGGGGRLALLSDIDGGTTRTANVVLGADPSFDNHGGDVSLTLTGDTQTLGDYAHGQIVQSIGAGGGETLIAGMSSANITIGAQDGSTGNGGAIDVNHDGSVTTAGRRAHGVVVQSIGGGGGLTTTDLDAANVNVTPSANNGGDGGAVTFTNLGNIMTMGDESVSLLAQSLGGGGGVVDLVFRGSAGGVGNGGTVDMTQTGNAIAVGTNAVAVLSQSEGGTGTGGAMNLSFSNVVLGGDGANGVAVRMDGGASNTLSLLDQAFLAGLNNELILGGVGNEAVSLAGGGFGNFDLGTGTNTFLLEATGRFTALERMLAGTGGQVTIDGALDLGGVLTFPATITPTITAAEFMVAGNVNQTTTLTGSLSFGGTATYTADVYFVQQDGSGRREGDLINASENGTMGGTLVPVLNTLEQARPYVLVDAGGTTADNGTTIQDTVVLDYEIGLNGSTGDGSSIDLNVIPDFSTPTMNRNQGAVGDYINDVLNGAGSAPLGRLFALIGNATTEPEVIDIIDRLTTEDYAATQVETYGGSLRFAEDLRTCSSHAGNVVLTRNGCVWMNLSFANSDRDGSFEYRSLEASARELQLGGQLDMQNGMTIGVAMEHTDISMSNGPRFQANGNRWQIGASIEKTINDWALFGGLSGGETDYRADRQIGINGTFGDGFVLVSGDAEAKQSVRNMNLRFGAEYRYKPVGRDWYLQPGLALDMTQLKSNSFNETGTGLGAELKKSRQVIYTLTPSIEFGVDTDFDASTGLKAFVRAAALFSSDDDIFVDASLPGASSADGTFRNYSGIDERRGRLSVGLTVFDKIDSAFMVDINYGLEFGNNSLVQSAGVKFGLRF